MKASEIKVGETYNGVKIIEKVHKENGRGFVYKCVCPICGKTYILTASVIGKRKSCVDCFTKSKFKDLSGLQFGDMTVLRHLGFVNSRTRWECVCSCGKHFEATTRNILQGKHRSCGCKRIALFKQKRRNCVSDTFDVKVIANHPLWKIWYGVKMRCFNPNDPSYKNYGGRGITMCDRWIGFGGFENFVNDMGKRPSLNHTLDRIDVNGNYCPENCRWATHIEQANNMRRNIFIVVNGEEISVSQFHRLYRISHSLRGLFQLITQGYDINFILTLGRYSLRGKKFREEAKIHINHNRVVSDEVMELLETKLNNK